MKNWLNRFLTLTSGNDQTTISEPPALNKLTIQEGRTYSDNLDTAHAVLNTESLKDNHLLRYLAASLIVSNARDPEIKSLYTMLSERKTYLAVQYEANVRRKHWEMNNPGKSYVENVDHLLAEFTTLECRRPTVKSALEIRLAAEDYYSLYRLFGQKSSTANFFSGTTRSLYGGEFRDFFRQRRLAGDATDFRRTQAWLLIGVLDDGATLEGLVRKISKLSGLEDFKIRILWVDSGNKLFPTQEYQPGALESYMEKYWLADGNYLTLLSVLAKKEGTWLGDPLTGNEKNLIKKHLGEINTTLFDIRTHGIASQVLECIESGRVHSFTAIENQLRFSRTRRRDGPVNSRVVEGCAGRGNYKYCYLKLTPEEVADNAMAEFERYCEVVGWVVMFADWIPTEDNVGQEFVVNVAFDTTSHNQYDFAKSDSLHAKLLEHNLI